MARRSAPGDVWTELLVGVMNIENNYRAWCLNNVLDYDPAKPFGPVIRFFFNRFTWIESKLARSDEMLEALARVNQKMAESNAEAHRRLDHIEQTMEEVHACDPEALIIGE